jgi:hemolysin activation/secretion protein
LHIHHSLTKPFRLTLSVDDSGYDATGRFQGAATLSLDNPLGLSDLLYASFNTELGHAKNDGGNDGYSLHYSVPYRYWLFSATTSEHEYWQNVAGLNQSYEYRGKSRRDEVGISRVVHRDSKSKLKLGLQAYKTSSRNFIEDTEIEVQQRRMAGWVAQLNYQLFIEKAAFDFGLAWQRGTGAFDALPAPEEAFDEGTSRPKIITANLNFNYPFELGSRAFNFSSYWEGQWNKTSLVPQDRFSIGGRYTVRGFDGESTLLAERGWFSRNTVSMRLGQTQHQLYTGIDVGHVSGRSADLLLGQRLAGWVVGVKGHWNSLFYDLFAGTPLDKPEGFEAGRTLGFNLTYQY